MKREKDMTTVQVARQIYGTFTKVNPMMSSPPSLQTDDYEWIDFPYNDDEVGFRHRHGFDHWEYPHQVKIHDEYRPARIGKNEAYIILEYNDDGPIVERWDIVMRP